MILYNLAICRSGVEDIPRICAWFHCVQTVIVGCNNRKSIAYGNATNRLTCGFVVGISVDVSLRNVQLLDNFEVVDTDLSSVVVGQDFAVAIGCYSLYRDRKMTPCRLVAYALKVELLALESCSVALYYGESNLATVSLQGC